MRVRFVEAGGNGFNWGKFAVGAFTSEQWAVRSEEPDVAGQLLLKGRGWSPMDHVLVLDLQTGEGSMFRLGGLVRADLQKHRIWVCPLFEPFLEWLYADRLEHSTCSLMNWVDGLPSYVELPDAEPQVQGYRRGGELTDVVFDEDPRAGQYARPADKDDAGIYQIHAAPAGLLAKHTAARRDAGAYYDLIRDYIDSAGSDA